MVRAATASATQGVHKDGGTRRDKKEAEKFVADGVVAHAKGKRTTLAPAIAVNMEAVRLS